MHTRNAPAPQARTAPSGWLLTTMAVAMLAACGGGGGADTTSSTETPQNNGGSTVTIDPVAAQAGAFYYKFDGSSSSAEALTAALGGETYSKWNPKGNPTFFAPGMRVSFFGDPTGCDALTKLGTVVNTTASALSQVASRTGLEVMQESLTWVPSGNSDGCSGVTDRQGPSAVYVVPKSAGGLALYTSAGPRTDGQAEFFGTFGSAGQDGQGTNANLTGTYVAFRQDWRSDDAVKPWKSDTGSGVARILVNQGLAATEVGSSSSTLTQVQQLFNLHVINKTCLAERSSSAQPCQLNYLFNSAIQRNNVTDWSAVSWAQNVRVWYDAAQGGIPIVEGPIKTTGTTTNETNTGWGMFSSKGYATQHSPFSNRSFDVRITMTQLKNLLKILTARSLDVEPSAVTEAQIAAMWSDDWAKPDAWVAESLTVAQEISSADRSKSVWLAGNVRQVYVGPAGS